MSLLGYWLGALSAYISGAASAIAVTRLWRQRCWRRELPEHKR